MLELLVWKVTAACCEKDYHRVFRELYSFFLIIEKQHFGFSADIKEEFFVVLQPTTHDTAWKNSERRLKQKTVFIEADVFTVHCCSYIMYCPCSANTQWASINTCVSRWGVNTTVCSNVTNTNSYTVIFRKAWNVQVVLQLRYQLVKLSLLVTRAFCNAKWLQSAHKFHF